MNFSKANRWFRFPHLVWTLPALLSFGYIAASAIYLWLFPEPTGDVPARLFSKALETFLLLSGLSLVWLAARVAGSTEKTTPKGHAAGRTLIWVAAILIFTALFRE